MDDDQRLAVKQLYMMFIVAADRLAELGYDSRGVAGPVVAEVADLLGMAVDNRPHWAREAVH